MQPKALVTLFMEHLILLNSAPVLHILFKQRQLECSFFSYLFSSSLSLIFSCPRNKAVDFLSQHSFSACEFRWKLRCSSKHCFAPYKCTVSLTAHSRSLSHPSNLVCTMLNSSMTSQMVRMCAKAGVAHILILILKETVDKTTKPQVV
jgi:hypothetical protein